MASVDIISDPFRWYTIEINFSGVDRGHVTISHGLRGGGSVDIIDEDTNFDNDSTNITFGVGEKGDYRFRDILISANSITAQS